MGPHNRSRQLMGCLFASALLLSGGELLANDLNAAHKAVRLQQYKEAVSLFREAAQAGHPEAQYQLANLYLQGRGTAKDAAKARQWFERAAEQGHAGAQFGLAQLIAQNEPERAQDLLAASAEQNYRSAKIALQRSAPTATVNLNAPFEAQWFGAARKNDVALLKTIQAEHDTLHTTDKAGRTALFYAIEGDAEQAARWLIEQGSNPDAADNRDLTPLQAAIERKRTSMLRMLLKAGANKNQVLSNGDNLLHYALRREHYEQAKILIEQGVNVNHRNNDGWTPLDMAEHRGADATAALLQKRGATKGGGWRGNERQPQDLDAVVEQLSEGSMSPLARAIINGNKKLVERILEENRDRANSPLEDGTTPLILALKHNKLELVRTLIEYNVQVNQVAYRGMNAVQVAAQRGDLEALEILLGAGAIPVHTDDQGRDAVMSAIEHGQFEAASVLLDDIIGDGQGSRAVPVQLGRQYAPVDRYILLATQHHADDLLERLLPYASATAATDQQERTALWIAANEGNAKLIPKLLKAGLPADKADTHGRTPFLMAVNRGCLECAKQLLPVSDINHRSNTGNTALMMAAGNGDEALTAWLIRNKAEIELRNQRGDTALMLAVLSNSREAVKQLLKADASVTRKNKLGFSSIDLAKDVGPQMLELVKSKSVLGIF